MDSNNTLKGEVKASPFNVLLVFLNLENL